MSFMFRLHLPSQTFTNLVNQWQIIKIKLVNRNYLILAYLLISYCYILYCKLLQYINFVNVIKNFKICNKVRLERSTKPFSHIVVDILSNYNGVTFMINYLNLFKIYIITHY